MILNNDEYIYSMSLMLLYVLKDHEKYGDLSQLSMILDRKNFNKFIDYFGGMTITIPTRDEVNSSLKSLAYYQLHFVEGYSVPKSRELSGVTYDEMAAVNKHASEIRRFFNNINEGQFNDKV